MLLLKQDDVQRMTYQNYDGIDFSYGDEEKSRKKFNRKLVRNYILFTLLGAGLTTGVFSSLKNSEIAKKIILGAVLTTVSAGITYSSYKVMKAIIESKKEEKSVI